jgi:hypothetical protein
VRADSLVAPSIPRECQQRSRFVGNGHRDPHAKPACLAQDGVAALGRVDGEQGLHQQAP